MKIFLRLRKLRVRLRKREKGRIMKGSMLNHAKQLIKKSKQYICQS